MLMAAIVISFHLSFSLYLRLLLQGAAEPMQVDGQVEENDNVEEDQFIVENSSIVSLFFLFQIIFL